MKNYSKDWWKYLKKGDTVRRIRICGASNVTINKEYSVTKFVNISISTKRPQIWYRGDDGTKQWSGDTECWEPVSMKEILHVKDYEIF